MTTHLDPVCGMNVDERTAAEKSDYEGKTYYFCSQICKARFKQAPEKYAGKSGQKQTREWRSGERLL